MSVSVGVAPPPFTLAKEKKRERHVLAHGRTAPAPSPEQSKANVLAQGAFIVIANTLEFAVSKTGGCELCPSTQNSQNSSPHPAK